MQTSTFNSRANAASRFFCFLQEKSCSSLADATEDMVQSFFCPDTAGSQKGHDYIHRVRTVLNVCLPMEPLHIRRVLNFFPATPEFRKNVPVLKPDEVSGIKEVLRNPRGRISLCDRAIGVLAFYAGLRSVDIVNLKISSIDWENDRLCFTQQKTQVPVEIPLSAMVGNAPC